MQGVLGVAVLCGWWSALGDLCGGACLRLAVHNSYAQNAQILTAPANNVSISTIFLLVIVKIYGLQRV